MNNKQYIQMMCAGQFYEKSAREAIQFFDTIAENARTWETNTSLDTAKVHSTPTGGKHPNFSWRNEGGPHNLLNIQGHNYPNQGFSNQALSFQNQGPQGFPSNPNQGFIPLSQGNSNPQPYQPPHKRSLKDIVTQFVQTQHSTNTEFRTALNDVRSQIT